MAPLDNFRPGAMATLIGSLPHRDHETAQDLVLKYMEDCPIWVQLPKYPKERLLTQFVEGFPGLVEDEEGGSIYFDTNSPTFEQDFLAFFEEYLAVKEGAKAIEDSIFAISEERAPGLFIFLKKVEGLDPPPYALKGQITGPFTLLTGLKEKDGRLTYYNPQLKEAIVQGVGLKAAFQAKKLREKADRAIVFLDEPALAGFGSSSMVGMKREEVQKDLKSVIDEVHQADALCGIHVCANTEWSLLLDPVLELDIISFDAFGYLDRFLIFKDEILGFLERGGVIAWGLVPTQREDDIVDASVEDLANRFFEAQKALGLTREEIVRSSLITPSCGTGLLSEELAERVLDLTKGLSEHIRM